MKKAKHPERWILGGVLILMFSISAKAAGPLCAHVFSLVHYSKMDDKVTDQQVAVFKKVIDDLNGSLVNLVVPKGAEIQIFTEHSAPVADQLEMSVMAGVRFVRETPSLGIEKYYKRPKEGEKRKYYKNPIFSVPILAHEYGHLIFMENYSLREPIWRGFFEDYKKLVDEKEKELKAIQLEMEKVDDQPTNGMTPEQINELHAKAGTLRQKSTELLNEISHIGNKFFNATSRKVDNYNEFFADVVAVIYTGDSSSIERSISFTRTLQGRNMYTKYFSQSGKERKFKNHVTHDEDYAAHGYFSLAREGVWDSYLASPSNRTKKRGEIMEAIFAAVAGEASRILRSPTPVEMTTETAWKEFNRSLLEAIDREMAARGLTKLK